LKLSKSPQLRDTTSPVLKLSKSPQLRADATSTTIKFTEISGIKGKGNRSSILPSGSSSDNKTPSEIMRSALIYKKPENSPSQSINLTSNIQNSSSNTTLNTLLPNKDNLINKRKDLNFSEFSNNSFFETDRKDIAFIPSKTSPLILSIYPSTEKRKPVEEKSNIPIYTKPDEISFETTDLSNLKIKGNNTSQSIVSPSSQLYTKNVLDKIEFLKDQTRNEILQNNDFSSPDIGEKDFKLVQFEDLDKIIKESSHELKIMETRIEEARQMMKGTASAWSPILNLSSTGLPSYTKGDTYHSLAPNKSTDQRKASLQATLKWDLINPSRTPQINTAKANFENAKVAYSLRHRDLLLEAKVRFLQLQHSLQDVRIAEDSINISQKALDQSLERMESGTGTKFDVLEASTQLSKDRQLLVEKKGNKKMNEIKLVQVLNMNQNTLPSVNSKPYIIGEWETSLEDSINSAYLNRKEIDDLQLQISVATNKSKLELAKTKPTVSIFNLFEADVAEGEANSLSPQTDNKSNSINNTVGLQFDWKIFDGGSSKAFSQAKEAKINEIQEQVLLEKSKVRKEVEQLFSKLEKSRLNIEHSYAAILSAKETLELSLLRQQSGLGVQREVLNSQRDLTQAEITHAKAINEYNISLVNLQILTGLEA
jgi:OMF family outer membrane factor